ncbi:hypothetical protein GGQ85_001350 [Nitrobacter vulgaris]|nr:hypothetical protein [Nitrobacter vulgaris]
MSIDGATQLRLFLVALHIRSNKLPPARSALSAFSRLYVADASKPSGQADLQPFLLRARARTIRCRYRRLRQTTSPRAAAAALRIASMFAL